MYRLDRLPRPPGRAGRPRLGHRPSQTERRSSHRGRRLRLRVQQPRSGDRRQVPRIRVSGARTAPWTAAPGGLHPWNARLQFIEDHLDQAVAIGEVGLDYHKRVLSNTSKDRQHIVFSMLLSLGQQHRKPVIIHSRYAWRDSFALTKGAGVELAVFHWYTGPSNVLREILDAGYFVSATMAAEYHAEHRRAVQGNASGQAASGDRLPGGLSGASVRARRRHALSAGGGRHQRTASRRRGREDHPERHAALRPRRSLVASLDSRFPNREDRLRVPEDKYGGNAKQVAGCLPGFGVSPVSCSFTLEQSSGSFYPFPPRSGRSNRRCRRSLLPGV